MTADWSSDQRLGRQVITRSSAASIPVLEATKVSTWTRAMYNPAALGGFEATAAQSFRFEYRKAGLARPESASDPTRKLVNSLYLDWCHSRWIGSVGCYRPASKLCGFGPWGSCQILAVVSAAAGARSKIKDISIKPESTEVR